MSAESHEIQASAVAYRDRGLVITGDSGSGKSTLALELIALGAELVADDVVILRRTPFEGLVVTAPSRLTGLVEARGIGILRLAPVARDVPLALIADLDWQETERLPPLRERDLFGRKLPVIFPGDLPGRAARVLAALQAEERLPPDQALS